MSGEVRAVVHAERPGDGRPGHLRAVGRPAPEPAPGTVVVEVHVALLAPGAPAPSTDGTVVGTEAAGVVAAVGDGVTGFAVGDGVALPALLTCGRCPACRAGRSNLCPARRTPGVDVDGWLAERVVVPAHLLTSRPATVPAPLAASVPGVVATAYHALKRAGTGPGVSVAVVGAGPLGLHVAQLGALAGGEVTVLDDRAAARDAAEDLGADAALPLAGADPAAVLDEPVDRVVLTPDHPVVAATAAAALAPGGRLVIVEGSGGDVAVPLDRLVRDELDVVGASGATAADVVELFDLAAEGRLVLQPAVGPVRTVDQLDEVEAALADTTDLRRVGVDPRSGR